MGAPLHAGASPNIAATLANLLPQLSPLASNGLSQQHMPSPTVIAAGAAVTAASSGVGAGVSIVGAYHGGLGHSINHRLNQQQQQQQQQQLGLCQEPELSGQGDNGEARFSSPL